MTKKCVSLLLCNLVLLAAAPLDTDGDNLLDSEEDINANGIVDEGETDPLNADTDGGGEADGSEVRAGRNPFIPEDDYTYDADGDLLPNGVEATLGTNPHSRDSDGDSLPDALDPFPLDHRYRLDRDNDGMPDEYEALLNFSDTNPRDADEDADRDGISNRDEFLLGTHPRENDTDRDGVDDGRELELGTDPQENPCLEYGGGSAFFADAEGHWAKKYIYYLHQTKSGGKRIVQGYTQGDKTLFAPNTPISRFELLKIALLSSCTPLLEDTSNSTHHFADIPAFERPRESDERKLRRKVVYTAAKKGIIRGYEDGSFRPDEQVNRAEALKILLLSAEPEKRMDDDKEAYQFSDVSEEDWFESFVYRGSAIEIVEGFPDGTFGPQLPITRAEASKIVLLLMVTNHRVNGYVIPANDL
jgi:hypothetical protein